MKNHEMLNPTEFKKQIIDSALYTVYKDLVYHITYPISGRIKLGDITDVYRHFYVDFMAFDQLTLDIKTSSNVIGRTYSLLKSQLENLNSLISDLGTDNGMVYSYTQLQNRYNLLDLDDRPGKFLNYHDESTKALIKAAGISNNAVLGCYGYFTKQRLNTNDPEFIQGYFIGLNNQHPPAIETTKESQDLESLKEYKEAFLKEVGEISKALDTSFIAAKDYKSQVISDYKTWFEEIKKEYESNEVNSRLFFQKAKSDLETLVDSQNTEFHGWFKNQKEDAQLFNDQSKKQVESLKKTYEEELSFSYPAQYWKLLSKKSLKRAYWLMGTLIGLILITIISLTTVLVKLPEDLFIIEEDETVMNPLRWVLILITLVSFAAYGIKSISKAMFSAFHLARDGEERNSLTYFYLSLKKRADISDKERELIMQSLFSRAETGLLKDDASPTMPSNVLEKLFNK